MMVLDTTDDAYNSKGGHIRQVISVRRAMPPEGRLRAARRAGGRAAGGARPQALCSLSLCRLGTVPTETLGFHSNSNWHKSGRDTWGQHQVGHCIVYMFLTGTCWVLPLSCDLYLPKIVRAYLFPQSVKSNYVRSGPMSVEPVCPQPNELRGCLGGRFAALESPVLASQLRPEHDEPCTLIEL